MKRVEIQHALFLSALVLAAGIAGCGQQSTPPSAAYSKNTKPGPEESFEAIVETFRRGVEDIPIGFVVRQESGHSMMTGKNEVSHELIPPAEEGDPYKAIITVNSHSSYSIQRSNTPRDTDADEAGNSGSQSSVLGEDSGLEILDPELVGVPGASGSTRRAPQASTDKMVDRRANEVVRTYDLVYEQGRWSLVTKLDPETEQSIQNAFDQALKTQI